MMMMMMMMMIQNGPQHGKKQLSNFSETAEKQHQVIHITLLDELA
jgi:hypothetical protein